MVTPELISYLQEQLVKGENLEIVKPKLIESGWAAADVEAAIAQVQVTNPSAEGGLITVEKSKSSMGMVAIAVVVLALLGGGYYFWQKNSSGVKADSALASEVPAAWQTYSSTSGSPGYTVKYAPDWQLTEGKNTTIIQVQDGVAIGIIRQNDQSSFSDLYASAENPKPEDKVKLVKKSDLSLGTYQAQRYELFVATGTPQEGYVISTEVLAGTTRWGLDLTVSDAKGANKDNLNKYKEAYLQLTGSFQPQ